MNIYDEFGWITIPIHIRSTIPHKAICVKKKSQTLQAHGEKFSFPKAREEIQFPKCVFSYCSVTCEVLNFRLIIFMLKLFLFLYYITGSIDFPS